jgi:NitT/TauT family transport system substrate-binding protein
MFPHIPGVVLAATGAFAKAHPAALDQMIRLTIGATDMIRNDPMRAAAYVQKVLGGGLVPVPLIAKSLTSPAVGFVTDPREIAVATEAMLAYEVTLGDFQTAPSTDGLFDVAAYDRAVKGG